jgi:hypothetical protein
MASVIFNKTVVNGQTVRFFMKRSQASARANMLTRTVGLQYGLAFAYIEATNQKLGWLIENRVTKSLTDIDGPIPAEAASALRIMRR